MKKCFQFLLGMLTFLYVKDLHAQNMNLDFEEWIMDSSGVDPFFKTEKEAFQIKGVAAGTPVVWNQDLGVNRTTDAYSGQYAAVVHHWYNINPGVLQVGRYDKAGFFCGSNIQFRPSALKGYYKFIQGQVLDTTKRTYGYVEILLTRYQNGKRDTIGKGTQKLHPMNVYTPFSIPIDYWDKANPDSIALAFYSGMGLCRHPYCNYLYVDALKFMESKKRCRIFGMYPNPTNGLLTSMSSTECFDRDKMTYFYIYSLEGKLLKRGTLEHEKISIENLPQGFYVIQFEDSEGIFESQKIVKI
jgi:hypothetical protein